MKKILVANRGEIALRIMRSAKEMGIQTVAIYSEADELMPFVRFADEAFCIGPAPSSQSYLLGNKIIEIAKQCGAEGIHPGYGFLSENAEFSQAVTDAGIIFIGPTAHSINTMGSKIGAKQSAKKYNVPMVPGTDTPLKDAKEAHEIALKTGFPLLIKASAGGGGKGMRIVNNADELEEQMNMAKSEALNSFNDDSVFIEKYVGSPKHIEIQVLGDKHGNYVYLFERECSIQRRHQKLIEEAPSSCLTPEIRKAMGESAVNVARSCDYHGAGTVEFLADDDLNFYFLEMNTRLQVEHCVTEMITGIDLVKEQIKVARGEALSFGQDDLKIHGHAVELRICAEDPYNNFLPDIGKLEVYKRPQGSGIRVDDGYEEGMEIPIYYDPMIGKLVAWGANRQEAIDRLSLAIAAFRINGIETTLPFGAWAIKQPAFVEGKFDTHFIANYFKPELLEQKTEEEAEMASIIAVHIFEESTKELKPINQNTSQWKNRKQLR
ncbi:MAG TPA: acetyl-CoA carboxylase biotin carboxylase subunit [Chitinophagaceae bacterium]|nr:acetyl-CoA carboxylase biotin carboxylase subunit [Chitinophagaceae bacterium]